MERKSFTLKDVTATGEVAATIATLGVWDKDGDWTEPGFIGTQPVAFLNSHNRTDLQLGKGVVSDENGKTAEVEGKLFLNDPDAEKLHTKLRNDLDNPPALLEWSYGLMFKEGGTEKGTRAGRTGRILRPLPDGSPGVRVPEVSPVLVGAGEGTGTTSVKAAQLKLVDHILTTSKNLAELLARVHDVTRLREEKGQTLGDESMAALTELAEQSDAVQEALAAAQPAEDPAASFDLDAELQALLTRTDRILRGI